MPDLGYQIFAVDFDGTLCDHQYPAIGSEKKYCISVLKTLQAQGDKIILWTCRDGEILEQALQWLKERDFVPDIVNENWWDPNNGSCQKKVYCHWYIDDRNWPQLPSWKEIGKRFIHNPNAFLGLREFAKED